MATSSSPSSRWCWWEKEGIVAAVLGGGGVGVFVTIAIVMLVLVGGHCHCHACGGVGIIIAMLVA